jgi:response regulator of citrate/malate metabolism
MGFSSHSRHTGLFNLDSVNDAHHYLTEPETEPGVQSETTVVFQILGVLAKARDVHHALVLDEIAEAMHLNRRHVERYMDVLQRAGAVRAEVAQQHSPCYSLTRYGLERLGVAA